MSDAAARTAIATAIDETLVVEAAAGTGKTTALVGRIVHVLGRGAATIDGIVAVTFTEKAAGELKLRVRHALEQHRSVEGCAPEVAVRLEAALAHLEDARMGTIHAFCADLLREFPVEAGLDPLFRVLTDLEARRLFDQAFTTWLQAALDDPPDAVRRALSRSARPRDDGHDGDGPIDRLRTAAWTLVDWRDFTGSWQRPPFDREAVIGACALAVASVARRSAAPAMPRDRLFLCTAAVRRIDDDLREALAARDLDRAEARLVDLPRDSDLRRPHKGTGLVYGPGVPRADLLQDLQALVVQAEAFRVDADADLAAGLREEFRAVLETYEDSKARHGALDFLDLLLRARDLVRANAHVRGTLQRRIARIFIDEFQDTDPLQAEILLLLAGDDPTEMEWRQIRPTGGKLFVVGDPKQSIYRFRRADVSVYRQVCDQLVGHGARVLYLTTSFRAVPAIQDAVNAAFAPLMTGDRESLQAHYLPLEPSRVGHAHQPAIVALPVPRPYGTHRVSAAAIEASLPDATGAFLAWLVHESGWTVSDPADGRRVPIAPRHICVLFRRFLSYDVDVTRAYVDAIEARGLPHLLVGGRAFHGREEIESLRVALTAIEWPDDELSVFGTLHGAFFALGDEALLEYHAHARGFRPFAVPAGLPAHLTPVAEALQLVATLHRGRNRVPIPTTLSRLFEATRAHVGLALRRNGEQVLANVRHVSELARQYEQGGGLSFRGFVDVLADAAREGQATEAPIVEEGSDGVRLMTVHKAKGLEFPVVVLADLTAKLHAAEPSRVIEPDRHVCALRIGGWSPHDLRVRHAIEQGRDEAEGIRLAYVAATRARDLLVIPAVGDQSFERGWLAPLDGAVYPPVAIRRHADPAPGCPVFRRDSVLARPDDETASPCTVSPGRHRWETDASSGHEIVWWDPSVLRLDAEPPYGLRRAELIARDAAPAVVAAGHAQYQAWRHDRDAALASGTAPSCRVRTVTEWAAAVSGVGLPQGTAIEHAAVPVAEGRPAGARFGTLVHTVLAIVGLDEGAAGIEALTRVWARTLGASEEEVLAAVGVVPQVLAHPFLRRAAQADWCVREMPVTLSVDGEVIEGVMDLAFEDVQGTVVVDYKTDRSTGDARMRYERQLGLYAAALARTGHDPIRAVLLEI